MHLSPDEVDSFPLIDAKHVGHIVARFGGVAAKSEKTITCSRNGAVEEHSIGVSKTFRCRCFLLAFTPGSLHCLIALTGSYETFALCKNAFI